MAGLACGKHRNFRAGCFGCRRVDSAYNRRRRQAIAAGTWLPAVPADVVLGHINHLRDSGVTVVAIARAARVNIGTLHKLTYGRAKTVTGPIAAALLAVHPAPALKAGQVPAIGTVRRIRALVAHGYALADIGHRVDKQVQRIWALAHKRHDSVSEDTHRLFSDLYDQLALISGPSVRARNQGRRLGWPPPAAWHNIDDPDAHPYDPDKTVDRVKVDRVLDGTPGQLTEVERHHAVHIGIDRGMTAHQIATRLRMSYAKAKALAAKPLPDGYELAA